MYIFHKINQGDLQTVLELTKEGAEFHEYSNLNRKDGEGRTALFIAAASGFTDIVRELIKLKVFFVTYTFRNFYCYCFF
jgi:hypothetical protein